ncbi:MAG: UDP-N-acetylmuramoyl-tripeptide--D-alanyl-D-alanine ligase [Gammaproteobacteria bacterium]|jgi:UDP-N-acetylmuramoyl-tripeptide--D-alanyl-D-alanine ligase
MLTVSDTAKILNGRFSGNDVLFTSVSTDSRAMESGALFVALRGERFDAHDFLAQACSAGAVAAMVQEGIDLSAEVAGFPLLHVADTKQALGALARHWRSRFAIPVIAISGSNGKTTVKEMIAAILHAQYGAEHVLATKGNLNNDIGVPLTLLRLRDQHHAAVIELGINHPGETRLLAGFTQPTVGLVNNAQREHQEFMNSVQEVAEEHADLFTLLPLDGTAVINADDRFSDYWRSAADGRRIVDFGLHTKAAVTADHQLNVFGADLELHCEGNAIAITSHAAGLHNVYNAIAAAAASFAAGVDLKAIKTGIENFAPVKGRMQRTPARRGGTLIDDTYNANPDSVLAAIDVLARMPAPRILALGDMGEVGSHGKAFHAEIGQYAREAGIEFVFTLGELSHTTSDTFGKPAEHFESIEKLIDAIDRHLHSQPTVLIKGSRFMRMERVVQALGRE